MQLKVLGLLVGMLITLIMSSITIWAAVSLAKMHPFNAKGFVVSNANCSVDNCFAVDSSLECDYNGNVLLQYTFQDIPYTSSVPATTRICDADCCNSTIREHTTIRLLVDVEDPENVLAYTSNERYHIGVAMLWIFVVCLFGLFFYLFVITSQTLISNHCLNRATFYQTVVQ